MYFLLGLRPNVETVVALARPFADAGAAAGTDAIAEAYRRYLADLQPGVPRARSAGVEFVADAERQAALERLFELPASDAAGADLAGLLWPEWKRSLCDRGLERLGKLDGGLDALFRLVVNLVFTSVEVDVPGSATVGPAVGVVWLQPDERWGSGELVEALVHELAHTLLMLDEHRYGHYVSYDELQREENLVVSAIREERRPISASFHSVVVAFELLTLRERLLGHDEAPRLHGTSRAMLRKTLAAVESLLSSPRLETLVTPRTVEIAETIRDRLRDPDHLPSLAREAVGA